MGAVSLVVTLLSVACLGWCVVIPCPEEGCKNFTIYLGPKWGSKVIVYPNYPKVSGTPEIREENNTEETGSGIKVMMEEDSLNPSGEFYHRLMRRPIPEDNTITVDERVDDGRTVYDRRPSVRRLTTTASPFWKAYFSKSRDVANKTINFSGRNMTGEDVKKALQTQVSQQTRRLLLGYNNIYYLPRLTFPLELEYSLQELSLDNNPFGYLSGYTLFEIKRLGYLEVLNLTRTRIRSLPPLNVASLRVLDLTGNYISYLSDATVSSLPNLEELYLDNNHFQYFYEIQGLSNLKVLSLTNNELTYVSEDAFLGKPNLEKVFLNHNSLSRIDYLGEFHYNTQVFLSNNPWECSCPLLSFLDRGWPDVVDKYLLTCRNPDNTEVEVSYLSAYNDCNTWRTWIMHRWSDITRWVRLHIPNTSTLISLFWWAILVGMLVVVVRARLHTKAKNAPKEVPYNVLDDKHAMVDDAWSIGTDYKQSLK